MRRVSLSSGRRSVGESPVEGPSAGSDAYGEEPNIPLEEKSTRSPRTAAAGQGLRLLVVDDEEGQRRIVAEILTAAGYQVETAGNLSDAIHRLQGGGIELVITDLKMPGGSGIELLERVKELDSEIEVILTTAFSTIQTAVEAMRKGAYSYLPKPFEKDELLLTVAQVREKILLRRENRKLQGLVRERFGYGTMLGSSPRMQEVYEIIEKVHSNGTTVLIRGESGTGKELVARAIHSTGIRRGRPFVAINCAAIPEMLIESELFGHEKGAFTGALTAKVGRFEEVEDGTLFLDEIGSMHFDLQAKLLRVIQEREFQRIGSSKVLRFDGRIVAATSQDLEALMKENRFREDLYFRLNVVPIELPALRERAGDLSILACHFLRKYAAELGKETRSFSSGTLDLLEGYDWPGNVRELENVVERMVVLADDTTEVLDETMVPGPVAQASRRERRRTAAVPEGDGEKDPVAPPSSRPQARSAESRHDGAEEAMFRLPAAGVRLADVERELMRQALARTGGRLEPAARLLGITYKTMQYRTKKYGL